MLLLSISAIYFLLYGLVKSSGMESLSRFFLYNTEKYGNAVIESKIDHLAQSERISQHQHDTCNMMLGLP